MIGARGRIRLAALLATGFIFLRLLYAFFFSGLGGSQVLFSLPELVLAGPFSHITLFGEVSLEGISRNIQLALPFALSILLFGLLSALITPERVRRASGAIRPLRNLLTALAIALASMPSVIAAAKEANWSRKIRGERPMAILVPIFERMVQRAGLVGLELAKSEPKELASNTLKLSGHKLPGLKPIDLTVAPGEVVVLSGETGSGKSTLLQAISGELREHHGRQLSGDISLGDISLNSLAASAYVALVPQLPQQSFIAETVAQELGQEAISRDTLGVSQLAEKPTHALSHGEAYRVAIARAISRKPSVLLIDEPTAALDAEGMEGFRELVATVSDLGTIVIIADHRPELVALAQTTRIEIRDGTLAPPSAGVVAKPTLRKVLVGNDVLAKIAIASIENDRQLIKGVNLELRQAQCVAITGPNGSGKSTLLRRLGEPEPSEVEIHGVSVKGPNPKLVALVPDRPSQFFVSDSLGGELARADRIAGASAGLTAITLESILGELPNLSTHPLDLSIGTQLALSVAMQLSHKPQLLLLDEPVQGLDPRSRELMAETIRCVQETGCAVVIATHDIEFARGLATSVFRIAEQELKQVNEVIA